MTVGAAPSFELPTPFGPAQLTFLDGERALVQSDRLTVVGVAYDLRLYLRRDPTGRFADDGLFACRVADPWEAPPDSATRPLAEALRGAVDAFAAAQPAALTAAAAADAFRRAEGLEAEAGRLEERAAAKRAEAAALRAAAAPEAVPADAAA